MATLGEVGRIGQRRYTGVFFEEFLPELRGAKGAEVYTEMADNDSTIGAILFAFENLMRNCEFTIEPAGNKADDKKAAEFVQGCMDDMDTTWTDTLSEILSFITYGWSYHEIVYKRRMGRKSNPADSSKYDDGLIGWKRLPIRSQETLKEWKYKEHTDELLGMEQWVITDTDVMQVTIPLEKALHFVTRSRKRNPEGRSVLRTAYRNWYFKKRFEEIEGIGVERDLAGFPTLTAAEGFENLWDTNDDDMATALANAERIVTNVRRDSKEGLVLPPGWKMELLSTGSRRQFDTNQIIERENKQIATSVLTDFVLLGHESVGSFALADNKTKMFALAVGTFLDIICEVFNKQAIPRLIDLNGEHFKNITDYPYMKHGDIEDANLDKIGSFIQQMVGAGTLTPDDELEDYIRQIANLPERTADISIEERKGDNPDGADQNADGNAQPSQEGRREQARERKREMDIDDKQDKKEADEAKKSLGRPGYEDYYSDIDKANPYHDHRGRFTTPGAASMFVHTPGASTKVDKFIANETAKAQSLAAQRVSDAKAKEPQMTALMQKCASEAGGEMVGLDFAVKGEGSLTRKITSEIKDKGITAEEAAASMKDVNRYTMQLNEKNFTNGFNGTMKSLQDNGYEVVRVKNSLAKEDAEYRGINCNIKSPDGSIWELQFHTAKSLEIKEVNHKLYEEQRLDTTSKARKTELGEQMIKNAKSIPTPDNVGSIKNINLL